MKWYTVIDSLVTAEKQANLRSSLNNFKVLYILLYKKETDLLDNARHSENYVNHICEDDNKICNIGTSKSDGAESHIADKCLGSKYSEVNDPPISNHRNTPEAMNKK